MSLIQKAQRSAFGIIIGLATTAIILLAAFLTWAWNHDRHATCLVEGKDRTTSLHVSDGNGSSKSDARIYTTCGVFKVGDALFKWKFNSADTYASIKEGQTYELTYIGWRFGPLSTFPNVIEAKEANK